MLLLKVSPERAIFIGHMIAKRLFSLILTGIFSSFGVFGAPTAGAPLTDSQGPFGTVEKRVVANLEIDVIITAYSSTPEETDDTPFITASGERVRDGIVAANFLPFGTRIQIPEIFGDKVFKVKDRMHKRKKGIVDVWMPTKQDAINFGVYSTHIVVLDFEELPELALAQ